MITQPDKPSGRGLALLPTPVKAYALAHALPVIQPQKARDGVLRAALAEAQVDVALVVAYGKILPLDVLQAPRLGCLNVHGSLLPRWRGAAPIQWAIVSGDTQTGVCLMQMDIGMDTGDVLARRAIDIEENETGGELFERLSKVSGELVRSELPRFFRGELVAQPQPSEGVTHARMIEKSDGALDFTESAQAVHDRARGFYPWPGAFTTLDGKRVKLHRTRLVARTGKLGPPGSVLATASDGIVVACQEGALRFEELQLDGKKRVSAQAFLAGHPLAPGAMFQ
ncbi:MAG: Methionyl-tRNA formyltransferase [Myxococcaceae bacterium]|nr:Methionyl-tRNA formyltransferase [Myxococcaceae bacterium]